jgi:chromosomal replication initiator protein
LIGVVEIPLTASTCEPAKTAAQQPRRPAGLRQFVVGRENRLLLAAVASCFPAVVDPSNFDVQAPSHATLPFTPATGDSAAADQGAAADQPGAARPYSPLVLIGAPGTGKSHFALGMARYWRQTRPEDLITCATGADFARELNDAIETRTLDAWRARYRSSALLVLDEVHQLASRGAAQVELLHTLDALAARDAMVIVTSRLGIAQITNLLPALESRLVAGLSIPLSLPGLDARRRLVERLAAERGTTIEPEALSLLAERFEASVPELFGALMFLETSSLLDGGIIRLEHARRYIHDRGGRRMPTLRGIAAQTAKHFSISPADLKSASRRRAAVQARGVAMHLARQLTGISLQRIGDYFGGRDHTTVLHGCRRIEQLLADSAELRRDVEQLITALTNA